DPSNLSALRSSVTAAPTSVTADGAATTAITATVRDANGNAVSGQSVSFQASGSGNVLGTPTGTTNSSGVVATTLRSTTAEVKTVTATVSSTLQLMDQPQIAFTAGPVSA